MLEHNNIYDKIQELLGDIPGNLSILEEQIDAEIQMEYYNYCSSLEEDFDQEEVISQRDYIFRSDISTEDKKHLFVKLANTSSIEVYRTLEKYLHIADDYLKDWATLALKECRLLLESNLLDKSQVLISTGLGGKGLKLRYYTVLIATNGKNFTSFEHTIITDEVQFAIKKSNGELEEICFDRELCTILSIIPLQTPVQQLFNEIIAECNQYGGFLETEFIITNVRILPCDDVRELILHTRLKK